MAKHQLNTLNKLYIGIAAALALLAVYRVWQYQEWSRVYYSTSVTAPFDCPVFIKELQWLDQDGEEIRANLYSSREQVNNFNSSWGDAAYVYQLNHKLKLPQKLVLNYVSYRDSAYYQDTISLPKAQIAAVFAKLNTQKNLQPVTYMANYTEVQGLSLVLGLANNGGLVLWLRGSNFEETLLKTQLRPSARLNRTAGLVDGQKLADFREAFMYLPDTVKTLVAQGKNKAINYADSASRYLQ